MTPCNAYARDRVRIASALSRSGEAGLPGLPAPRSVGPDRRRPFRALRDLAAAPESRCEGVVDVCLGWLGFALRRYGLCRAEHAQRAPSVTLVLEHLRVRGAAAGLVLLATAPVHAADERGPSIAAAASLRPVVPGLVTAFRQETGDQVRVSFAATGKLTRQILRGAPFELLLAADPDYPQRLVDAGRTEGDGTIYAHGRLGLFAPGGSPLESARPWANLTEAIDDGAIERFAIANPHHAPYGERSRTALRSAGLWGSVQPVLVLGDNAAQAAQFAAADSRSAGIVPASYANADALARAGNLVTLPDAWYSPLAHRMVLMETAGPTVRAFARFMQSERARTILAQNGFRVPGDSD